MKVLARYVEGYSILIWCRVSVTRTWHGQVSLMTMPTRDIFIARDYSRMTQRLCPVRHMQQAGTRRFC
jgi:hypothetical protein